MNKETKFIKRKFLGTGPVIISKFDFIYDFKWILKQKHFAAASS